MKLTKSSLGKLDKEYAGYLEGKKLDSFFNEFGIDFAAGHWSAGGFADRFAPGGYNPGLDESIIAQIERVAKAGIKGIEFHEALFIDKNYKKDKSKIDKIKESLAKNKVEPTNMNTNLFGDPKWKLGGITNVNKSIREDALAVALQGVEIAKEVGCKSVALWPGSDGWDYNFEVNYGVILDRFIEGCIAINKKTKELGLKFGIEAKLHEPREGNMVVPTTHLAILIAKEVNEECGETNMGVAIDYGHEQMYAVEPASMLYAAKRFGVPVVNLHVNNAKLHSNDEDRIAGTGDIWRLADFCYAAIDTGYNGWIGEDQFTYRTDAVKSMLLSREFFGNIMKKSLMIYAIKDKLEKAQSTGDAIETIEVVKKYIIG
ncbi:MAG: TIM barrel protein [Elusimicrobia bacterium]|nr:TIM barrel protein [Elusimicrobiota bacterium]